MLSVRGFSSEGLVIKKKKKLAICPEDLWIFCFPSFSGLLRKLPFGLKKYKAKRPEASSYEMLLRTVLIGYLGDVTSSDCHNAGLLVLPTFLLTPCVLYVIVII